MNTESIKPKKFSVFLGIVGFTFLLFWFWQLIIPFIVGFILVICATVFAGKKTGIATLCICVLLLFSIDAHWIKGKTVCLADPEYTYLWKMDRTDADNVTGSVENEGGSISISFSAKSDDMIPGADYAKIQVVDNAELSLMQFSNSMQLPKDMQIKDELNLPESLHGKTFYVPKHAEFRTDMSFDSDKRVFNVADLPVLIKGDEKTYTPVGVLRGLIELGDTAVISPALFDGRNLVVDGNRRATNTETNRTYFADKKAEPLIIVDKLQRDWLTMRTPSHLYLHKYAEAYDCRPETYQAMGLGGLFKSNW